MLRLLHRVPPAFATLRHSDVVSQRYLLDQHANAFLHSFFQLFVPSIVVWLHQPNSYHNISLGEEKYTLSIHVRDMEIQLVKCPPHPSPFLQLENLQYYIKVSYSLCSHYNFVATTIFHSTTFLM